MTFYTTFTTADGIKAAYIYQTKRQLIAADQSGTFKAMQEVKHNKAEAGIKAIKAHLQNNGYKVLRPVKRLNLQKNFLNIDNGGWKND